MLTLEDRKEIVELMMVSLESCGYHKSCVFAEEQRKEILRAVEFATNCRRFAFWAGAAFTLAVITSFAGGCCYIIWVGLKMVVRAN